MASGGEFIVPFVSKYVRELVMTSGNWGEVERCLEAGAPFVDEEFLAILMIDISGYSKLTSQLAKMGKISSEILTTSLNEYLGKIISIINCYDGDVVKFLGDALLVHFRACIPTEGQKDVALKAFTCALDIMRNYPSAVINISDVPMMDNTVGQPSKELTSGSRISRNRRCSRNPERELRLHTAITCGVVSHVIAGDLKNRLDYFIFGEAVEELGKVLEAASADEIGLSRAVFHMLSQYMPSSLIGENTVTLKRHQFPECLVTTKDEQDTVGCTMTAKRHPSNALSVKKSRSRAEPLSRETQKVDILELFVNKAMVHKLSLVKTIWKAKLDKIPERRDTEMVDSKEASILQDIENMLAEYRYIVVVFVKLCFPFSFEKVQTAFKHFTFCLEKYHGVFQQFSVDDKGQTMFACFGLPGKQEKINCFQIVPEDSNNITFDSSENPTQDQLLVGYEEQRNALESNLKSWISLSKTRLLLTVTGKSGCGKSCLLKFASSISESQEIPSCVTLATEMRQWTPYFGLQTIMTYIFKQIRTRTMNMAPNYPSRGLSTETDSSASIARRLSTTSFDLLPDLGGLMKDSDRLSEAVKFLTYFREQPNLAPLLGFIIPGLAQDIVEENLDKKDGATIKAILLRLVQRIVSAYSELNKTCFMFDDAQLKEYANLYLKSLALKSDMIEVGEDGLLDVKGGETIYASMLSKTAGAAIMSQFDRLDPVFQSLLKYACIIGQYFTIVEVKQLLPDPSITLESCQYVIENLDRFDFLRAESGDRKGTSDIYLFCHISICNSIYDSMSFSERRKLHAIAAEYYVNSMGSTRRELLPLVCYHLNLAQDLTRSVIYMEDLCRKHIQQGLYHEGLAVITKLLQSVFVDPNAVIDLSEDMETVIQLERGKLGLWISMLAYCEARIFRFAFARDHSFLALKTLGLTAPTDSKRIRNEILKSTILQWRLYLKTKGGRRSCFSKRLEVLRKNRDLISYALTALYFCSFFDLSFTTEFKAMMLIKNMNFCIYNAVDRPEEWFDLSIRAAMGFFPLSEWLSNVYSRAASRVVPDINSVIPTYGLTYGIYLMSTNQMSRAEQALSKYVSGEANLPNKLNELGSVGGRILFAACGVRYSSEVDAYLIDTNFRASSESDQIDCINPDFLLWLKALQKSAKLLDFGFGAPAAGVLMTAISIWILLSNHLIPPSHLKSQVIKRRRGQVVAEDRRDIVQIMFRHYDCKMVIDTLKEPLLVLSSKCLELSAGGRLISQWAAYILYDSALSLISEKPASMIFLKKIRRALRKIGRYEAGLSQQKKEFKFFEVFLKTLVGLYSNDYKESTHVLEESLRQFDNFHAAFLHQWVNTHYLRSTESSGRVCA
ncbi:Adenylate cyclase type 10 [Dinochytrium kinnereticum]|nr:Adenylate cyclase type 10 [Dinochytrium kinnereticum]